MTELKPCPFCGGKAFVSTTRSIDRNHYALFQVYCKNALECGARTKRCKDEEQAIGIWNRRYEE